MILTVTLNPAVDKTVKVDNFQLDQVNRIKEMRKDAGGKGINVSHTISALGRKSKAFAVIGGQAGDFIKASIESENIAFEYLSVEGETRTNTKIVDEVTRQHTDINEPGPKVDAHFEKELMAYFEKVLTTESVLVLSGSLLPGLEPDFYKKIVEKAVETKAIVILDADGPQLVSALQSGPHIIKPNIHELSGLAQKELSTEEEIIDYCRTLMNDGLVRDGVLVSLGEEGSLWITPKIVLKVEPMKVDVKSTVGAGDAMVAALAVALDEKMSEIDMLKWATAAAVARISTDGPIQSSMSQIEEIRNKINIRQI